MRKRKSKSSFCQVDHLELRQLLSATIYVSAAATAATPDGLSWATAFTDLQSGLTAARADTPSSGNPVIIEVGQGTYYPTSTTGPRTASFQLIDDVSIQGGYAGAGASNPDARDVTLYPTTLSGDIGTQDVNTDNSYHVVYAKNVDNTAVLDGFTITDGNANASGSGFDALGGGIYDNNGDPTLNDCTITNSTAGFGGGGVYAIGKAPTLSNCTISGNTAGTSGGGMYIRSASIDLVNCTITGNSSPGNGGGMLNNVVSLTLTNCIISNNSTPGNGGGFANINSSLNMTDSILVGNTAKNGAGMFNLSSSPALTNCTLSGNTASKDGGAIYNNSASSATLTNCILYGDTATSSGNEIYNATGGSATITYSDVAGGANGIDGNINANPNFIRAVRADGTGDSGDLRLQSDSPAIDAGSDSALSAATDLDGLSRIAGNHVDMGAYESHYPLQSTLYVDASATGAATGSDWADAYPNLAAALDYAVSGETIDVAQGTYYPSADANRFDTFQLVDGVSVEGGFAGQANPNAARDVSTYTTTLSGDIGAPGVIGDNTYSVVTGSGTDNTAILDGFTITAGYASNHHPTGGGITNYYGSPSISHCTITGNTAGVGGGIYDGHSSPILYDCIISQNAAFSGGGIENEYYSSPAISDCTITENTATGNVGGGIDNFASSSPTLTDCSITENQAVNGGGISVNSGDCSPVLTDCSISGNTASDRGGGIDNHGDVSLVNCVISGNTAQTHGGGIYNNGGASIALTNCTISGNNGGLLGGAIDNTVSSSATLSNSILWGDTAANSNEIYNDSASSATITFSDVQGGFSGTGNIDADPKFVRAVGTNGANDFGDLELLGSSPAINSGSNSAIAGTTTDLAGNPRISDGTVDMGAYETQAHLAITAQPTGSVTAGSVFSMTIQVEDPNGDVITNDNSNFTIDLGASPGGAALGGTLNATADDGVASFSGLSLTSAGTYSLASSNSILPVVTSNNFTITAGAPAQLVITQQPGDATAGQDIPAVNVEVEDQYGNPVDGTSVDVALSGSTGASLGGTTTQATSRGVASFSNLAITHAGTYTLSITDGDLPALTSSNFTIDPAAAAKLAFTVQPAGATAGQAMPNFAVEAQDQYGNLVSGNSSTVSITSTPAGITTSVAAANGIAIFTGISADTAGTFTLSASDGALAGTTSNSFTITPGTAAQLVITQQPADTLAGQNIPVQVEVEDQYGNAVDGTSVTLTLAGSTPSGTILAGTLTEPTANGIAAFSDLSLNRAGTFTLSASNGNLPAVTTQSFAITYAGPQLVFATEPASAIAGGKLPAFTIDTDDTAGNIITTGKSTIILTLSSNGKIYGTTKAKVKNGVASFKNISLHTAGTYTLTASDSSYAAGTSSEFTIAAGAGKKLAFDPQPANAAANTPFNVSVELVDKYGNAVDDGSTVDLVLGSHPKTAAALNLPSTITDGFADFDGVTLDTAGKYTLKASDGKVKATSKKFAVT